MGLVGRLRSLCCGSRSERNENFVGRGLATAGPEGPLVVELLGLLVEGHSLSSTVHQAESGDPELLPGLHNRGHPSARFLVPLAVLERLLGHHLASLVEHQIGLDESSLGVLGRAVPHLSVGSGLALLRHPLRLPSSDGLARGFGLGGSWLCRGFWRLGLGGSSGLASGLSGGSPRGSLGGTGLGSGTDGRLGGHFGLVGYVRSLKKF